MTGLINFFNAHQVICTLIGGYLWSSFISALPAPGATSSVMYQFWFKFLNVLAANLSRASSTKVEGSPNFQSAVNIQNAKTGEEKIVVQMPAETKP